MLKALKAYLAYRKMSPEQECVYLANRLAEVLHNAGYQIEESGYFYYGIGGINGTITIGGPYGQKWEVKGPITAKLGGGQAD